MKKRDQAIGFLVVFLAAGMLISCGRSREVEQDAEARVEEAFTENGITDFEKMDLSAYEQQTGVALVDDYVSYHFFYESDGLAIEAYLGAPRELLEQKKPSDCLIYNHGETGIMAHWKALRPHSMRISIRRSVSLPITGDVEKAREPIHLADRMWTT